MKHTRILILAFIALFGLILTGCISDDISDSPGDVLTFSCDTVSFDTVFTGQGTPTARLIVHNRNKKGVNISHIGFKDPQTRFRLNVDGQSGDTFHDIEIRSQDSIYVFIECYPEESPTTKPALIADKLEFITNGVSQEVTVEAYGQNVTRLKALVVQEDMTLTAEQPYVVFDSLVVAPGVKLSINPGTQLLFHDKAKLIVRGTLNAVGEKDNTIDIRGDRLDNVLPDVSYDIMAGQWDGVRFTAESFDNRMEYVDLRSTRTGVVVDSCGNIDRQKLLIVNSWLHNSQHNVLTSVHAKVDAYGCVFSEAANSVVALTGGKHEFVHCTIANNYLFSAITGSMLQLGYCTPDDTSSAGQLMVADFENCIIYGLGPDLNIGDLSGSQVYLRNVLFKSKGENDDNFINCLWDKDPLFYTVREEYVFDYRLMPDSPGIGAGDSSFVNSLCRYDMDGLDRLSRELPDLGAYVFVAPPPEEEEQP